MYAYVCLTLLVPSVMLSSGALGTAELNEDIRWFGICNFSVGRRKFSFVYKSLLVPMLENYV